MTKPARSLALASLSLLLAAAPAHALIDDYSTAPGQGAPDGLDDVWQAVYNAWGLTPGGDEDNDGCSNFVECVAGSNPRQAGDCLMVGNMAISGSNVVMTYDGKKGKRYQVWQSDTPAGPAPGEAGSAWTEVGGAAKDVTADGSDTILFSRPAGSSKFYRLESKDLDTDSDGVSDWAEDKVGTDIASATSATNASGGTANDLDTLRSLMSLTITPGTPDALEKEGVPATVKLKRTVGTMALTVSLDTAPGAAASTKSSADGADFIIKNTSNVATNTVTLPANQGTSTPYEVARIAPVPDAALEVPEALKVCLKLPGVPNGFPCPETTVNIKDADGTNPANRQLYVAFLGREADVVSTASGYATALVEGDNNKASIGIVFNNLSSDQNTAYIRVGSDLEVLPLPLGQVSGANWNIRAAQTEVTDQAMLNALKEGRLYVAISTANNPVKEIWGYFNKANGSTDFDSAREDLASPALGDPTWPVPTGDALEREIWRFMSQATFGGTSALYAEIRAECDAAITGGGTYLDGLSSWLDKQIDPVQSPQISLQKLVMAADMEEFALRGNKPITYNSDPQLNGGSIGVTFVNGMPMGNTGNPDTNAPGQNYPGANGDSPNKRREWWTMITQSKDHVRQRVAQALHEICVISERDATVNSRAYGAASYWDMIAAGAFGKYRTLLENVSMHPMMGVYLTSVANRARYDAGGGIIISPDENYAREIMQLFSIGLVLRHPDGSLQLSAEGLPIATYDNNDITELARVFTGFSHGARHGNAATQILGQYGGISGTTQQASPTVYLNGSGNNVWFGRNDGHLFWPAPWTTPMKVIGRIGTTIYHDYNTYTYLDTTQTPPVQVAVPGLSKRLLAGKHGQLEIPVWDPTGKADAETHAKAAEEVSKAHDALAGVASDSTYGAGTQASPGHTNTPVNISRWMIQRLVTSNPSAGYIYRVQKAFRDGNGLLGPVVKAILLDHEARSLALADGLISHGKVKEPLVHFASILRQFRAYSGAPVAALRDMQTSFSDLDAPMTSGYPASEVSKFNTLNLSPPSKPASWPDGPFRFRIDSLRNSLGQSPQDAPSVFNWFLPDFQPAGRFAKNGLFAPELQISTEAGEVSKVNFLYNYTWMTLGGMSTTPGISGADFVFRNGWATPAARFSTNGGSTLMGWPASIVLNSTNWNTGITLTLVPVNDQKIDQIAAASVRFAVSGSAVGYSGVATPTVPITFVDNEKKNESLIVTQSGGNTWVQEGGATDDVSIYLSCPPAVGSTVTVTLTPQNGEATVSPSTLTFDDTTWNVPQSVVVTAIDDSDIEDGGTGNELISITTSSTAANFDGVATPSLLASVVDNDNAFGVLITQSGGTTDLAETNNTTLSPLAAGLDSYTIVLTKQPTSNVVINLTPSQIGIQTSGTTFTTSATTRTFTATTGQALSGTTSGWNVPQTIYLRGNNDTTSEGPHTGTVTHTISSTTSGGYPTTLPIQQVVATIVDDDNSIIFAHTGTETRVMEGEFGDTVTVRLRSNPNAQVSVTLGGEGLKFTPSQLVFNPTGSADNLWSTDQTVTVTALDDYLNEGVLVRSMIAYSTSSGTNYNGTTAPTISATVLDNDDARLIVTESSGSTVVNENGTNDTYTLSLGRRPDAGSTTTVTLTPSTTGIQVTPAGPFTFTDSNWNTPVVITVSTPNDGNAETRGTATIRHDIASTDPTYNVSSTPYVVVTVDDNDPALTIAQTNIFTQVKEGGAAGTGGTPAAQDTFTVVLPRAPAAGTTVTVTLNTNDQISVNPSVLTFTSATTGVGAYNATQTVTVSAIDDLVVDPTNHTGIVNFNIASTDSYFNGAVAPPVIVQVTDNDSPGISIVETGGTTSVTEGSTTTDSYTVVLTQAPTANVDVVVDGGTQLLVSKSGTPTLASVTLNFTPATWAAAQTVNVLPVNDTVAELRHLAPITHTITGTSAAEYAALTSLPTVTGIITDNDNTVAANVVRITESSNATSLTESGATVNGTSTNSDTFTVVLSQQPTANVTVTFTPNSQVTVTPSTLTFVPGATGAGTFNVAQTVTVRSVDDFVMEPILHWGQVTATVASADPFFDGKAVSPVTSSVYDNDGPSVNVLATGTGTVLTENGATDTYTISLNSEPAADVVVTITPDAQVTASPTTLTFTNSAGATPWNVPQTITLTAVDDSTAEAVTHNGVVSHSIASTDALWNNLSIPTHTAQIWDNDVSSIDITPVGGNDTVITEGGASDSILIKLNQPPVDSTGAPTTVTISLYPPSFYVPPPQIGKTQGYFTNDQGSSNQRDNIVLDYVEPILLYRSTFYGHLTSVYGTIPASLATSTNATDLANIQNAHWLATKTVIDKMDLWFSNGYLKAQWPILVEPNKPSPTPMPPFNPRQAVMDAIYRHSGGSGSPATTRYAAEVAYNPKSPPTSTFETDVRDRVRWAAYLMTVGANAFTNH